MALENWRRRARGLKRDTFALYLAARDPRVPWYTKALALGVVGYALSPIDLIPDFIPIIGYLDDLILVPLGIALVLWLTPGYVLAESRERAQEAMDRRCTLAFLARAHRHYRHRPDLASGAGALGLLVLRIFMR